MRPWFISLQYPIAFKSLSYLSQRIVYFAYPFHLYLIVNYLFMSSTAWVIPGKKNPVLCRPHFSPYLKLFVTFSCNCRRKMLWQTSIQRHSFPFWFCCRRIMKPWKELTSTSAGLCATARQIFTSRTLFKSGCIKIPPRWKIKMGSLWTGDLSLGRDLLWCCAQAFCFNASSCSCNLEERQC